MERYLAKLADLARRRRRLVAVSSFSDVRRPSTGGQPTRRRRIASRSGTEAVVGGMTASVVDTSDAVTGSLWKILLFVLAASYLVLLVCCGACSCRSRRCS